MRTSIGEHDIAVAVTRRVVAVCAGLWAAAGSFVLQPFCGAIAGAQAPHITLLAVGSGGNARSTGRGGAATVSDQGTLYVLDAGDNTIHAIDRSGRAIGTAGGSGGQPGALVTPVALTFDGPGDVLALDVQAARVNRYRTTASGLRYQRSFTTGPLAASDVCAMRDRVYVLGPPLESQNRTAVHVFTRAGAPIGDFGALFGLSEDGQSDRGAVPINFLLTRGRLACVDDQGLVVVLPRSVAEVRAYSVDGVLVWSRPLPRYRPTIVRRVSGGGVALEMGPDGIDEGVSVVPLAKGVLAIQIARTQPGRRPGEMPSRVKLETRLLAATDGRELGVQDDIPELAAVRGSYAAVVSTTPGARTGLFRVMLKRAN